MTDERELYRRTVLQGTATLGAAASLAGCSSLPIVGGESGRGDDGLSYGDEIEDEITPESPTDPVDGGLGNPHEFTGSVDEQIEAEIESDDFDTVLLLVDGAGELVRRNDDEAPSSTDSSIIVELPSTGSFTLCATSASGEATGTYTLSLDLY
jgi:hypothetical protein